MKLQYFSLLVVVVSFSAVSHSARADTTNPFRIWSLSYPLNDETASSQGALSAQAPLNRVSYNPAPKQNSIFSESQSQLMRKFKDMIDVNNNGVSLFWKLSLK